MKAPKVYLRDTGMLHHLLNLDTLDAVEHHPVHGASFETFVLEDLIRRERLRRPHTQVFFWRTAAGAEADLLLERGSSRVLVEVKAGRGDKPAVIRTLAQGLIDSDAHAAWIIDQAGGADPVRPRIHRRGIAASLTWLPPSSTSG